MTELFGAIASWWTLSLIVVVFGFAPGFILRLLVKIYPREDPRRDELTAQLYVLGRLERPLFVAEQLETVLFEGLPHRMRAWRRRRSNRVRKSGNRDGIRAVFRKIVTTVVLGAVAFPFIQLLAASLYVQVALTAGFGSIVLLIQILIDFEERLAKGRDRADRESH